MSMTVNPLAVGYPVDGQLVPQGFLGGLLGGPLGGWAGGALGGLLGNPGLGRQIGSTLGGIGGSFLPFSVDPGVAFGQVSTQGVLLPQNAVDPESQALAAFIQSASACLIPKLSAYLSKNAGQFPQLNSTIPLVTRAAELYGQADYARAFAQIYQAYRSVALLRGQQPALPDPAV